MRKHAKAVNFGIVYGIGAYSLSKDIGTSVKDAKKYIENYLNSYPLVEKYLDTTVKEAEENGYTVTPLGRRRYIPELKSTNGMMRAFGKRVAMNAPIQGAAADVIKLAMVKVDKRLREEKLDAYLVMQVHDELIVEAKDDIKDYVKVLLKEEMENAFKAKVPLTADASMGKNWLEQA
jgi:DNA polymerase-1